MSFLTGQTRQNSTTPREVMGVRQGLGNYLRGLDPSALASGRLPGGGEDLSDYQKMFAERRAYGLAQAKESVGNLTGSGLGNTIGTAAGRSISEENAFLANLLETRRQNQANRIFSFLNQGVGPEQTTYQPGFLDYLFQGAAQAAPFLAGA